MVKLILVAPTISAAIGESSKWNMPMSVFLSNNYFLREGTHVQDNHY